MTGASGKGQRAPEGARGAAPRAVKAACGICGAAGLWPSWRARYAKGGRDEEFTYFQCGGCGCLQIEVVPDNLAEYYDAGYYSFEMVSDRKLSDPALKKALRRLTARVGTSRGAAGALADRLFSLPEHHDWFRRAGVTFSSRILDVGCGAASRLVRIWKEGFTGSMGADPYIPADIRYGNGLVVLKAGLGELDGPYDFIMMNHSLEHVPDQHWAMKQLKRLLAPGGTALVRVPVAAYAWERYRADWVQLSAPEHLYLHTEKSMTALAGLNGLTVRETVFDSMGFQFWGSELLKRGVPIGEHGKNMALFTKEEISEWENEANRLNAERRGDMACFYLVGPGGESTQ